MTAPNPFQSTSPSFTELFIFGCGGSGREIAWLATQIFGEEVEMVFLVDQPKFLQPSVSGLPVKLLSEVQASAKSRYVAAIGNSTYRRHAVSACTGAGYAPTTLIHPRTEMSRLVVIGDGSIICAGSVVTTNVTVGQHVHINVGCTVSHDVVIGDFATLSPGVHISGHVQIGCDVFVGTGASVINGSADSPLVIGDGAVIAAGACVTRSVDPGSLVAGVPAVRKR